MFTPILAESRKRDPRTSDVIDGPSTQTAARIPVTYNVVINPTNYWVYFTDADGQHVQIPEGFESTFTNSGWWKFAHTKGGYWARNDGSRSQASIGRVCAQLCDDIRIAQKPAPAVPTYTARHEHGFKTWSAADSAVIDFLYDMIAQDVADMTPLFDCTPAYPLLPARASLKTYPEQSAKLAQIRHQEWVWKVQRAARGHHIYGNTPIALPAACGQDTAPTATKSAEQTFAYSIRVSGKMNHRHITADLESKGAILVERKTESDHTKWLYYDLTTTREAAQALLAKYCRNKFTICPHDKAPKSIYDLSFEEAIAIGRGQVRPEKKQTAMILPAERPVFGHIAKVNPKAPEPPSVLTLAMEDHRTADQVEESRMKAAEAETLPMFDASDSPESATEDFFEALNAKHVRNAELQAYTMIPAPARQTSTNLEWLELCAVVDARRLEQGEDLSVSALSGRCRRCTKLITPKNPPGDIAGWCAKCSAPKGNGDGRVGDYLRPFEGAANKAISIKYWAVHCYECGDEVPEERQQPLRDPLRETRKAICQACEDKALGRS